MTDLTGQGILDIEDQDYDELYKQQEGSKRYFVIDYNNGDFIGHTTNTKLFLAFLLLHNKSYDKALQQLNEYFAYRQFRF